MKLIADIVAAQEEHTQWRRDIHTYPEIAFQETRTATVVAEKLASWGIEVTTGLGKTGVVGTLKVGSSNKVIGLRADMDALAMDETNDFAHKSKNPGCKHGCGHDGHTVMLLAAAQYLAKSKNFDGTVQFFFQPAEESNPNGSGAKAMIEDGLFKRFPVDCVFGMHNIPEAYLGAFASSPGVLGAAVSLFEVTIKGRGAHGAYPSQGNDPIIVATQLISAWQTIVSRNVNAKDIAVLTVGCIQAGDTWNVIPETALIKGTVRTLSANACELIETRFRTLTNNIAEAFGVEIEINYRNTTPMCVNDATQTAFACDVADEIFGKNCVQRTIPADMGAEDFGYMAQQSPGCYMLIGTAPLPEGAVPLDRRNVEEDPDAFICKDAILLHEPDYDFNDDAIPIGATLFARLAEMYLS